VRIFTSAIDSGFIWSSCPLLPVSIVNTPSIVYVFWPLLPWRLVPTMPGANVARAA
jgi:hypothetical protein